LNRYNLISVYIILGHPVFD